MDEPAASFLNFLKTTPNPARFVVQYLFFTRGGSL